MSVQVLALAIVLCCLCTGGTAQQHPERPPLEIARAMISTIDNTGFVESPGKCGTPVVFEVASRWAEFPLQMRDVITTSLQRPMRQTSRTSLSGRFRIHYDTTGINQPAMLSGGLPVANSHEEYVDSVGAAFDHVWNQEIVLLGFGQPPPDGAAGAEYDIYLADFSNGTFGYTDWIGEAQVEAGARDRFASFIVMENDFRGYRTEGLAGMRVTAAHEFHHAIQVGAYGIWNTVANSDFYFYELTSTWLEDVVYSDVSDYLFDLPRFFQQYKDGSGISYPFTEYSSVRAGYERTVWAHFLARRYGTDVMRQIWEEMKSQPALRAQNTVLKRGGSGLATAFGEFTVWNFYTADRADTVRYYPEGRRYPRFVPNISVTYGGIVSTISTSAPPLSCQFYAFSVPGDTVTAIIANTDFEGAYADATAKRPFTLSLGEGDPTGADQRLSNGLTMGFKTENYESWRSTHIGSASRRDLKTILRPFPNPIRLSRSDALFLPVADVTATDAEVFFLSSSFDLSLRGRYPVRDLFGTRIVAVPAGDLNARISSGVHIVVLKTAVSEYRWKIAIMR